MSIPKTDAIHSMQVTLQRCQNLELILRFQEDSTNASLLGAKNKALRKQIDKLIIEAMKDWLEDAQEVTTKIKNANKNLQISITNVKNKKQKGENIVKALGLIDDVISIATSLLP
ncbi:hypothetical protein [Cellvibrio mixtus]|uniref:hypothetical protein n=1 Tax=Cellvibrio mixtus TaxID=39650 RepID=UPI000693D72F|nr:hypothetical protein [Cellvibrio mixtus]